MDSVSVVAESPKYFVQTLNRGFPVYYKKKN